MRKVFASLTAGMAACTCGAAAQEPPDRAAELAVFAVESGEPAWSASPLRYHPADMRGLVADYAASGERRPASGGYLRAAPVAGALGLPAHQAWMDGLDSGDDLHSAAAPATGRLTVGYAWPRIRLEGSSLLRGRDDSPGAVKRDLGLLDATSSRLMIQPAPGWTLQLSRGNLSNLDQLEAGEGLRRTAVSATYRASFDQADWRTTVAWGRNVRRSTGSTVGYLVESTVRLAGGHALFGRLERARSNEDAAPTENLQRQMFRTNRLTLGYYLDLSGSNAFRYDVGAMLTRYLAAPTASAAYSADPATAMMFVRIWLP